MSRSCMVAVVIFIFAAVVVVVVLLSSSSLDKNIWCVGGVVPWGGKNYNHTTAKNLSEVTAVSSRYDESSRRVATEEDKRRTRIPTDGDRCVFETGLVYSAEEQVGCIPGDRLCVVTRQYSADHFANG